MLAAIPIHGVKPTRTVVPLAFADVPVLSLRLPSYTPTLVGQAVAISMVPMLETSITISMVMVKQSTIVSMAFGRSMRLL